MPLQPRTLDPDKTYEHRFHAGNVGDVWKHVVLGACLDRLADRPALRFVDSHAGAGRYRLHPTGEWTEGVGRVLYTDPDSAPPAVEAWRATVRALSDDFGDRVYPGSPLLWMRRMRPDDRAVFVEKFPQPHDQLAVLVEDLGFRDAARVIEGEAATAVPTALAEPFAGTSVVHIDPAYAEKPEWAATARLAAAAHRAVPDACVLVWYPVKGLSRPRLMMKQLEEAGTPAVALELITCPLDMKKNRLNGSGMIAINPPPRLIEDAAAAAAWLGPRLAIVDGTWSASTLAWGRRAATRPGAGLAGSAPDLAAEGDDD